MSDAAREEAALEEATARTAAADSGPSSDADIAQVPRSGRQHNHTDTAACQQPQFGGHRGPRR